MKLDLVIHNEVPPEGGGIMGYRYTHAQDGHVSHALDMRSWIIAMDKHCKDNEYPTVDPADAIDQLCRTLPSNWCRYENGTAPVTVNTRLAVQDVLRGTKTLASFIVAGMPLVSRELAESRSATCARCFLNVNTTGCAPCFGLASLALSIAGGIKTPSDPGLRSCGICKCQNLAQTRIPIEILAKQISADELSLYPSFCWKANETRALTQDGAEAKEHN